MQQPPVKDYSLNNILPGEANSKLQETPTGGYTFFVVEASHSRFSIEINDGVRFRSKLVTGDTFDPEFNIEKIRVINEDLTLPLNITIRVGRNRPIHNLFTVSTDEITPTLRSDTPLIIGEAVKTAPGDGAVDTWIKLLDADEFRSEVWLKTDAAAGAAFWNTVNPGAAAELFSRDIVATADTGGFLKLKTTAAIWVRLKTNHSVRALTFQFA